MNTIDTQAPLTRGCSGRTRPGLLRRQAPVLPAGSPVIADRRRPHRILSCPSSRCEGVRGSIEARSHRHAQDAIDHRGRLLKALLEWPVNSREGLMRRAELPFEEVRVPGALIAENAHAVVHPRDVGMEEQRVTVLVRRGRSRQPRGPRSEDDVAPGSRRPYVRVANENAVARPRRQFLRQDLTSADGVEIVSP